MPFFLLTQDFCIYNDEDIKIIQKGKKKDSLMHVITILISLFIIPIAILFFIDGLDEDLFDPTYPNPIWAAVAFFIFIILLVGLTLDDYKKHKSYEDTGKAKLDVILRVPKNLLEEITDVNLKINEYHLPIEINPEFKANGYAPGARFKDYYSKKIRYISVDTSESFHVKIGNKTFTTKLKTEGDYSDKRPILPKTLLFQIKKPVI